MSCCRVVEYVGFGVISSSCWDASKVGAVHVPSAGGG